MVKSVWPAFVALMIAAGLALGGCAATDSGEPTPGAIEVKEDLVTVQISIARSLLDPNDSKSDEEIVAGAAEKGMSAVVEGDAVLYTMTKAQRDEMLAQMRSSATDAADEVIADESNSVTGVEFNDAMTEFRVSVDNDRFSPFESLLVVGFYLQGALYQQFAGVAQDDIDVTVDFVDDKTGEVIQSGSYQEMRKNLED